MRGNGDVSEYRQKSRKTKTKKGERNLCKEEGRSKRFAGDRANREERRRRAAEEKKGKAMM